MNSITLRWGTIVVVLFALILIPFVLFQDRLNAFAQQILNDKSSRSLVTAGVVGLLGSDIVLPIPSSIVSTASGIFLGFWLGALASFLGMTIACVSGYWLGRYAGAPVVRRFVSDAEIAAASTRFERFGDWAIIASRPVPMLAEASVVLAGVLARPFGRFFALCCLSNLAVSAVYAAVGAFAFKASSFLLAFAAAILIPWLAMRFAGRAAAPSTADVTDSID